MKKTNMTQKTIASALAAIVMAGTFGTIAYADNEITSPEVEYVSISDEGINYQLDPSAGAEESVNPDAPTSEEIAAMRTRSNKNAVKENRLRALENILNTSDDDADILPVNPDAPTEEEIAAIRAQNEKKQQFEEVKREYERLKAELYGEEEDGIVKGDGTVLDAGNTEETGTPVDVTEGGDEDPANEPAADETPAENPNTTREKEVIGDVVIITDTILNDDGTKTVVTTVINSVSGTSTTTTSKYDADGKLIVEEPENKPENKPTDENKPDDKSNDGGDNGGDSGKDDKKNSDDGGDEEDGWFTSLLKDGVDKLVDKGIDKGLDYVFDNLLGGDDGWMGIVKKLPWDKVCGTVCNVIDSSLGGDGSGNNGKYSMEEISAAFAAAYQRAESQPAAAASADLISETKATLPDLKVGNTVEHKLYSSSSASTSIDTKTTVKNENMATSTTELKQHRSDGSSIVITTEITEIRNSDGTVTTQKRVITNSRLADYVRGKKIGYVTDNTDITLTFVETPEEYLARIDKEQQEEAQYGTLSIHSLYNVDENGKRI